jgi:hypothetical protein
VAAPSFSPAAGSYGGTQSVTITSATSGASLYYTTNGTTPTSGSTAYTVPVSISSTATLKAIGYKNLFSASAVTSGTYTITASAPAFGAENTRGTSLDAVSSKVITLASGIAAGARSIVIYGNGSGDTVSSVTDSAGNTYTLMKGQALYSDSTNFTNIYSAHVTTALSAGATITVNFSASNYSYKSWMVCSATGCASSGQPDQIAGNSSYSASVSASASPATSPTLLIGVVRCRTSETYSGGGWTAIGSAHDVDVQRTYYVYKAVTGTSAQDMAGTLSGAQQMFAAWAGLK